MILTFQDIAALVCVALAAGVAIRKFWRAAFASSGSHCGGCASCPSAPSTPQRVALEPQLIRTISPPSSPRAT